MPFVRGITNGIRVGPLTQYGVVRGRTKQKLGWVTFWEIFQKVCKLKNVIYHFKGNGEFPRLRIGIRSPPRQMDPKAFLLQKFHVTARHRIDEALQEGVDGLKFLLSKSLAEIAKRFNKEQKYKHLRVQNLPV
ncbi:hypothetical protein Fmac_001341 [Flemingia macrophylla]|uniref:Uncharacterized protein n=1 Tax=Flemingia macrophylla TaxID=520843 RepID=A0ABD1NHC1_9FABA